LYVRKKSGDKNLSSARKYNTHLLIHGIRPKEATGGQFHLQPSMLMEILKYIIRMDLNAWKVLKENTSRKSSLFAPKTLFQDKWN